MQVVALCFKNECSSCLYNLLFQFVVIMLLSVQLLLVSKPKVDYKE